MKRRSKNLQKRTVDSREHIRAEVRENINLRKKREGEHWVYTKPGLGHGPGHGQPIAYPVPHSKFCNFTNYKENITSYTHRDQAAFFIQGVLVVIGGFNA